jgi:ABC-type branched-subunit amino acid transport system ATPase component/ABC-type branched-subunit amino acid transport system permease subunit
VPISLSLVVLTGMVGQVSLAQAAIAGSGGFVVAKIGTGIPFPLSLFIAGAISAILGVAIGISALRIRGTQLAVVTLAAAVCIESLVFNNPNISPGSGNSIPSPTLFGLNLGVRSGSDTATLRFALLVLGIVTILVLIVMNVLRGPTGRQMIAVRDNERAGTSVGIDAAGIKILAFAVSAFLAGVGGALIGYSRNELSPSSFGLFVGIAILAYAYLGGITSISGAIVAGLFAPLGIVYVATQQLIAPHIQDFASYYVLIGALGLIITPIINPLGIAGTLMQKRADRLRSRAAIGRPASRQHQSHGSRTVASVRPPAVGDVASLLEPVLTTRNLRVGYGAVIAVDSLDLVLRPGRITGLIGPNGAGKTTAIDAITGYVLYRGVVSDRHGEIGARLGPAKRARRGVVRTWQSLELFEELSVKDNVRIGTENGSLWRSVITDSVRPSLPRDASNVDWAIETLGLSDVVGYRPSELSLGTQKLVGVARSVAMRPSVILLDEPAAGLNTAESRHFGEMVRMLAQSGMAILLVDHDMELVLTVCDDVYVMSYGRVLAHGDPETVSHDERVVDAYLGQPIPWDWGSERYEALQLIDWILVRRVDISSPRQT